MGHFGDQNRVLYTYLPFCGVKDCFRVIFGHVLVRKQIFWMFLKYDTSIYIILKYLLILLHIIFCWFLLFWWKFFIFYWFLFLKYFQFWSLHILRGTIVLGPLRSFIIRSSVSPAYQQPSIKFLWNIEWSCT